MATKSNKKQSNVDAGEDKVNFRYSMAIMQQNGDKAGLANAKKAHPKEYADWEKRTAGIKKPAPAKKTGKK